MDTRKIQKSGTTYYLYLPASWCREHNITTDSEVYLERSSTGNLVINPKKSEAHLSSMKLELTDNSEEVINKMIIASFINPVKEFHINLKAGISNDQILSHKRLLGGLELVEYEETNISCQTSLALSDPDILLKTMIRKMLAVTKIMKTSSSHELVLKYEEEIDKINLLIHKSIISTLMYRRESRLRHVDLFYIGMISRNLESLSDVLISLERDKALITTIDKMLKSLQDVLESLRQQKVIDFVKSISDQKKISVNDLDSHKEKRAYSLLGDIAENLCDWYISDKVDNL